MFSGTGDEYYCQQDGLETILGQVCFFEKMFSYGFLVPFFRNPRKKTCRMVVSNRFFVTFFIFQKIICFHECKEDWDAGAFLFFNEIAKGMWHDSSATKPST